MIMSVDNIDYITTLTRQGTVAFLVESSPIAMVDVNIPNRNRVCVFVVEYSVHFCDPIKR